MSKPSNHGKKWTKEDNTKIKRLAKSGTTTPAIAKKLGRTKNAVMSEASRKNITLKPKDKRK